MINQWHFPLLGGGREIGKQISGQATFKENPIKSLVREMCQNSIDAGEGNSVTIEFSKFDLNTSDFPGLKAFISAVEASYAFWRNENSPNEYRHLEKILNKLRASKIAVLRISDFNTTGLTGSVTAGLNTKWGKLVRGSGISNNPENAGGSYGIGKNAAFVPSEISTVFYSTLDIDGKEASIGIADLMTYRDSENLGYQGTWYFAGDDDKGAISQMLALDPNFKRQSGNYGTDVYIMGFDENEEDWQHEALIAAISNFYYAIYSGRLAVKIESEIVDKDNLSAIFEQHKDEKMDNAYECYRALVSPSSFERKVDFFGGDVIIRILQEPALHKQVDIIRNVGMKIFSKSFSQYMPFSGVFYLEGKNPNKIMRDLEDPTHTKIAVPYAKTTQKQMARLFIDKIPDTIKEILNELMQNSEGEESDSGTGRYLPLDASEDVNKANVESISDKIYNITVTPIKATPSTTEISGDGDALSEIAKGHYEDDEKGPDIFVPNPMPKSTHPGPHIPLKEVIPVVGDGNDNVLIGSIKAAKVVIIRGKKSGEYFVRFTPQSSASRAYLTLQLVGEIGKYDANILSAVSAGRVLDFAGCRIKNLELVANQPLVIKVTLDYLEYCSMEVKAHGYSV